MAEESLVISVSQLNIYLKSIFDSDTFLSNIFVTGEVSNLKQHYSSGHIYFTLKDDRCAIPAVVFKSYASKIGFELKDGARVICHTKVSVFDRDTKVQLYVDHIQPFGLGSEYLAFEQLKAKLEKKGYFLESIKKPLPEYPKKVAVLTSESGSVFHDIVNVTKRRYPFCTLCLVPVPVQGIGAESVISNTLKKCDQSCIFDVIIIARGGGSLEDLSPFNSEILANAIYDCSTPVISAVGHETDYTICDFVSDLRAPTPSAAAEIAFKDVLEIRQDIDQYRNYINNLFLTILHTKRAKLEGLKKSRVLSDPNQILQLKQTKLNNCKIDLLRSINSKTERSKQNLKYMITRLNDLNPLTVLSRGYTITSKDSIPLRSISNLSAGDSIKITFFDGIADCKVLNTENNNE